MATESLSPAVHPHDAAFFGHPRGLRTLFFTEMFERFSYYGMRAFLIFYMVAALDKGGLGMDAGEAGIVYGVYVSSVYLLSLPGGWIADRFLGQQRAVIVGGTLIMLGHISLAIPSTVAFYLGLVLVSLGTGLLKPNASALVGQLYGKDDSRRDRAYSIYYMGVNLGALLAPFGCGYLAQSETVHNWLLHHGYDPNFGWHLGFGAAAVGMLFGLIQFMGFRSDLGKAGTKAVVPSDPVRAGRDRKALIALLSSLVILPAIVASLHFAHIITVDEDSIGNGFGIGLTLIATGVFVGMFRVVSDPSERKRLVAMLVLFLGYAAFSAIFEQAGSTLNLFADVHTNNAVFGHAFPSSWWNSVNSVYILLLTPAVAFFWLRQARKNKEPSSIMKFAIAMVMIALSMFVMIVPALAIGRSADPGTARVGPIWLLLLYFFSTMGELWLSPVGLSSMSKLAPARLAGMVMGVWFLAAAIGNYLAGRATSLTKSMTPTHMFAWLGAGAMVVALLLYLVARPVGRLVAQADATSPDA